MKENNKKKYLILTVIIIIIALAFIVRTAYAMFTANLAGTKENVLNTGYVSMSCNESNFSLENTHPLTDHDGLALTNNEWMCTLTTTLRGNMNIGYDVALYDVTPSATLTENNIKIRALKVKNNNTTYLVGTENSGAFISDIKSQSGQYDSSITNYKIDSTTTNSSEEVIYKIKAWVSSEDSSLTTKNTDGYCSDTTKTTQEACESSGGIWGYDQKKQQSGGTFSFKVKVGASQVIS